MQKVFKRVSIIYVLFIFIITFFYNINKLSAIYIRGELNSWGTNIMSSALGYVRFTTNYTASDSSSQFKFDQYGDWSVNWGSGDTNMSLNTKYTLYQSGNNCGVPVVSGNYYTYIMREVTGGGSVCTVLETSSFPVNITSVTDDSGGTVIYSNSVRVRITLSAAKSTEERVYVRYSSDGWSSDNFVLAASSNTTIYTCSIPAQNKLCTVSYYILTTTLDWAANNDLDNYPDLMTLRYNNNGGPNYTYNVSGIRTIDGNPGDWIGVAGSYTNGAVVSSGEFIWNDAEDVRNPGIPLGGGTNSYDLTEFRITSDKFYVYVLAKFKDIVSDSFPYISISIDSNQIVSSGEQWLGDFADVKVDSHAEWERNLILPYADIVRYYNTGWDSFTNGVKSMDTNYNCVEGAIKWSDLGLTNNGTYRFAVMVAQDSNGYTKELYGPDVLDVITVQPGNTWNEISDTNMNFYFDLTFNASGGVAANNNAPAAPSVIYPVSETITTNQPLFIWNTASDADGDSVYFYNIQLSETNSFATLYSNINIIVTNTNYYLTVPLHSSTIYYWRVRGWDSHGRTGLWSSITKFTTEGNSPFAPTNLSPADGSTADSLTPTLKWSFRDADIGDSQSKYRVLIGTNSAINPVVYSNEALTSATQYTTPALAKDKQYFWTVKTWDNTGKESPFSETNSFYTPLIVIDGYADDWHGISPSQDNTCVISSNEFIWKDKTGDERTDSPSQDSNFDITEVRITFDNTYIYVLVKVNDMTSTDEPNIAIAIDTNLSGGMDWIGADSDTIIGGDYGKITASAHYPDVNVIVHNPTSGITKIELFTNNGTSWFAPPTAGDGTAYSSISEDLVEFKIARQDVGLSGNKTARFSIALFDNNVDWANNNNCTYDIVGTSDALDTVGIASNLKNDGSSISAWDEDLSDGDVDFWFELKIKSNGDITNIPPDKVTTPTPANGSNNVSYTPTLSWTSASDPDDDITGYLLELNTSTNLSDTVLYRVNTTNTVYTIPSNLPDGVTCYWRVRARDRNGMLSTNYDIWSFSTMSTESVPTPTTPVCSPYIDGIKDEIWGNTPIVTSSNSNAPANYMKDLYLANDANYLYIGWSMGKDPWDESSSGYDKSAHFGWALETHIDAAGSSSDPFVGDTTTVGWSLKPDFWVYGWIKTGFSTFGKIYLYEYKNSQWNATELQENVDYGMVTNSWAEVKLSLKELGASLNSKIYLLGMFRPAEDKPGISDSLPYDSACSAYADTNANLTAKVIYYIRYALINTWHKPDTEEVVGLGTMRSPSSPTSSDKISVQIGVYPYDGYDSAYLIYTTNNWATSFTNSFSFYKQSGNATYLLSEIGPFPKNTTVKYINKVVRNNMVTYNYGSESSSSVVSNYSTAQANPYTFVVENSAPSAPQISITPVLLFTNNNLTVSASNSIDNDGDTLTYYFDWYKNDSLVAEFSTNDSTAPYLAKVINKTNLVPGDVWYCKVRTYDGNKYSEWNSSKKVTVLFQDWADISTSLTNSSLITNNEFIWFDKYNDIRDDVSVDISDNYDLLELHSKADSVYIYFLFKFKNITDANKLGIAIAVDTNQTADTTGISELGDDSDTTLKMKADFNLLLHSIMNGFLRVEYKNNSSQWILLSETNAVFHIYPDSDFCEARILRSVLGVSNVSKQIRFSAAVFQNLPGYANNIDVSVDYNGSDFLDTVSIPALSSNTVYNMADGYTAYESELFDNVMDYSFSLNITASDIAVNNTPSIVSGMNPSDNQVITTLTPAFSWNKSSDSDSGDSVTSYLLDLSISSNFDNLIYRVEIDTNEFAVPNNLPYGYTNYYWRVYSRDTRGALSKVATNYKFTVNISSPVAYTPQDIYNVDNYSNIQGIQDADGTIVWNWTASDDPAGVSNYYVTIGTSVGASNIVTNYELPGTSTTYSKAGLQRGLFYYAKLRTKNKNGIIGDFSDYSDGIYLNKILMDGSSTYWISKTYSDNTANVSNGYGIWQDAEDVRNSVTNLDLVQVQITADRYNLYLYFKFNSSWSFNDGSHFIQVAVDSADTSSTREFIGRNITDADLSVSASANWEYIIKVISGLDTCTICDTTYGNWKAGIYKENSADRAIECMVPLKFIGGAENILNNSINFSIAIFSNNSGNVQAVDGDSTPDALDVITSASSTWDEISDKVLDFYLRAQFDEEGNITSFTGVSATHTSPTIHPTIGAGSAGWAQNGIFYNIFVDRFYNGDTGNDSTGDPGSYGGDFQGIIDKIDYIRDLGVNVLALSPLTEYGYGGWGYGVDNWLEVENKYGGNSKLLEMVKLLKENNIKIAMDWPGTAVGTSWPLKEGDRYKKWAGYYTSPYGGWPENTAGLAEVQQFFSDAMMLWASKGIDSMRCDYAKMQGNPADHTHQFWQYVRRRVKSYLPDLYWYGEVKGDDPGYEMKNYVNTGLELDGNFDFPMMWDIPGALLDSQTMDAGDFRNNIDNRETYDYGSYPIMVTLAETHDDVRMNCKSGQDSWKVRVTLGFLLTYSSPPLFLYGTENGAYGCDNDMDRLDEYSTTAVMNFGSMWGYSTDQTGFIKHLIKGRKSFPGLRGSRNYGSLQWKYTSGNWLIYERNYYNDAILVIVNKSSTGANIPRSYFTTWASRTWRDWMNWSDYFYTDSSGYFTSDIYVQGNDVRILVSREYGGGFGATTVSGNVGVEGVIAYVKDYAGGIVTRVSKSDSSGNYSLENIVCKDTGGESRTIYFWYPGYSFTTNLTLYDSTPVTLNVDIFAHPDTTAPEIPQGLAAKPGDRTVQLNWTYVNDDDVISYYIYRSSSENGPFSKIGEALKNVYMDGVFGDLNPHLENGKTYYYKIRAVDKNGNMGPFSKVVSATPGNLTVDFYVYVGDSGYNVEKVFVSGNSEKMNFWGSFGPLIEMEKVGDGWYKKSFEFDPRMGIMYKYIIYDGSSYIWENNFTGTGSSWNNRYVDFMDQGDNKMTIINKWNVVGDAPPIRPQNLSASPKDSKVVLGWDKSFETDLAFYYIYRDSSVIAKVDASANSYVDNTVSNGITYSYYIQAQDIYGNKSEFSKTNSCTPGASDTTAPSVPENVSVNAYATNMVKLIWNANSEGDLAGYNIYRTTNIGSGFVKINKTLVEKSEEPYYIDTVQPGIEYFYTITAQDDSLNESGFSETNSAKVVKITFNIDMGNISASDVEILGNNLPLSWSSGIKLDKIDDYRWSTTIGMLYGSKVEYKYAYNNSDIIEQNFNTDSGNRELSINYDSAFVVNDDWESLPDKPENVWAFPLDGAVEIHWDANTTSEDLLGYNIYYSTNAANRFENKVNTTPITSTSYKIEGLNNGIKYYFTVRAVDSGDIELESYDSSIVNATPRKSVPVYFKVENLNDNEYK